MYSSKIQWKCNLRAVWTSYEPVWTVTGFRLVSEPEKTAKDQPGPVLTGLVQFFLRFLILRDRTGPDFQALTTTSLQIWILNMSWNTVKTLLFTSRVWWSITSWSLMPSSDFIYRPTRFHPIISTICSIQPIVRMFHSASRWWRKSGLFHLLQPLTSRAS